MVDFFKKNLVGLLGIVIGIMVSYAFFTLTEKEREPAFIVTKNVGLFPSPKGLSSDYFSLIRKSDGAEVLSNVYLMEAILRNYGKEPIKELDLLQPLTISAKNNVEFVKFFPTSSRSDIVSPEIKNDGKNKLLIKFKILEKKDYIKIQILYLSDAPQDFEISGDIIGVDKIKLNMDLTSDLKRQVYLVALIACTFSLSILLVISKLRALVKIEVSEDKLKSNNFVGFIVSLLLLLIAVIFLVVMLNKVNQITNEFSKEVVLLKATENIPQILK